MNSVNTVKRNIALNGGENTVEVMVTLAQWDGVKLMVHESIPNGLLGGFKWKCSCERTGACLGGGDSPSSAMSAAVNALIRNRESYENQAKSLPETNP